MTLFGQAGKALRAGARANKIVRVFVRVLKYSRMLKMFRYTPKASMRLKAVAKVVAETGKVDDVPEKSRVGAAMTDLMNQRCVAATRYNDCCVMMEVSHLNLSVLG